MVKYHAERTTAVLLAAESGIKLVDIINKWRHEYAELYDWQVFYRRILEVKIPTNRRSLLCGTLEYLIMIGQMQHSAVNVLFMNWPWTCVLVSGLISMEDVFLSRDKKRNVNPSLFLTIQTLSSELWVIKLYNFYQNCDFFRIFKKIVLRIFSLARNCKL